MSPAAVGLVALVPAVGALLALGARALRSGTSVGDWSQPRPSRADTPVDARLRALERMVADHLEARHPTRALAEELSRLADRRLVLRHGVRIEAAPQRAAELLGEETVALLRADPPHRMQLRQVDDVVRRIAAL